MFLVMGVSETEQRAYSRQGYKAELRSFECAEYVFIGLDRVLMSKDRGALLNKLTAWHMKKTLLRIVKRFGEYCGEIIISDELWDIIKIPAQALGFCRIDTYPSSLYLAKEAFLLVMAGISVPVFRKTAGIYDPDGTLCEGTYLERLIKRCSQIKLVTAHPDKFAAIQERILDTYGAYVTVAEDMELLEDTAINLALGTLERTRYRSSAPVFCALPQRVKNAVYGFCPVRPDDMPKEADTLSFITALPRYEADIGALTVKTGGVRITVNELTARLSEKFHIL